MKRQKTDAEGGGQEARLSGSDTAGSPLTSSRNSKQTLKSTISLLVFPSDGEQWLNTVPNPRVKPPQRKKNKIQSAKGTLAPVLCV